MSLMKALLYAKDLQSMPRTPLRGKSPKKQDTAATYPFQGGVAHDPAEYSVLPSGMPMKYMSNAQKRELPTLEAVMMRYDAIAKQKGIKSKSVRESVKYTAQRVLDWHLRNGIGFDDPGLPDKVLGSALKFQKTAIEKGRQEALKSRENVIPGTGKALLERAAKMPDPREQAMQRARQPWTSDPRLYDPETPLLLRGFHAWVGKAAEEAWLEAEDKENLLGQVGVGFDTAAKIMKHGMDPLAAGTVELVRKHVNETAAEYLDFVLRDVLPYFNGPGAIIGIGQLVNSPKAIALALKDSVIATFAKDVPLIDRLKAATITLLTAVGAYHGGKALFTKIKNRRVLARNAAEAAALLNEATPEQRAEAASAVARDMELIAEQERALDAATPEEALLNREAPQQAPATTPEAALETAAAPEQTPAVEETAAPGEAPSVEETVAPEQTPAAVDTPAAEEAAAAKPITRSALQEAMDRIAAQEKETVRQQRIAEAEANPDRKYYAHESGNVAEGEMQPGGPGWREVDYEEYLRLKDELAERGRRQLEERRRRIEEEEKRRAQEEPFLENKAFEKPVGNKNWKNQDPDRLFWDKKLHADESNPTTRMELEARAHAAQDAYERGKVRRDYRTMSNEELAKTKTAALLYARRIQKMLLERGSKSLEALGYALYRKHEAFTDWAAAEQELATRQRRGAKSVPSELEITPEERKIMRRWDERRGERRVYIRKKDLQAKNAERAERQAAKDAEKLERQAQKEQERAQKEAEKAQKEAEKAAQAEAKKKYEERKRQIEDEMRRLRNELDDVEGKLAKSPYTYRLHELKLEIGEMQNAARRKIEQLNAAKKRGPKWEEEMAAAQAKLRHAEFLDSHREMIERLGDRQSQLRSKLAELRQAKKSLTVDEFYEAPPQEPQVTVRASVPEKPQTEQPAVTEGQQESVATRTDRPMLGRVVLSDNTVAGGVIEVFKEHVAEAYAQAETNPQNARAVLVAAGKNLRKFLNEAKTFKDPRIQRGDMTPLERVAAAFNAALIPEVVPGHTALVMPDGTTVVVARPKTIEIRDIESFRKEYGRDPYPGETAEGAITSLAVKDATGRDVPLIHLVKAVPDAPPEVLFHELFHLAESLGIGKAEQWTAAMKKLGAEQFMRQFEEGSGVFAKPGTIFAKLRNAVAAVRAMLFDRDMWMTLKLAKDLQDWKAAEPVGATGEKYFARRTKEPKPEPEPEKPSDDPIGSAYAQVARRTAEGMYEDANLGVTKEQMPGWERVSDAELEATAKGVFDRVDRLAGWEKGADELPDPETFDRLSNAWRGFFQDALAGKVVLTPQDMVALANHVRRMRDWLALQKRPRSGGGFMAWDRAFWDKLAEHAADAIVAFQAVRGEYGRGLRALGHDRPWNKAYAEQVDGIVAKNIALMRMTSGKANASDIAKVVELGEKLKGAMDEIVNVRRMVRRAMHDPAFDAWDDAETRPAAATKLFFDILRHGYGDDAPAVAEAVVQASPEPVKLEAGAIKDVWERLVPPSLTRPHPASWRSITDPWMRRSLLNNTLVQLKRVLDTLDNAPPQQLAKVFQGNENAALTLFAAMAGEAAGGLSGGLAGRLADIGGHPAHAALRLLLGDAKAKQARIKGMRFDDEPIAQGVLELADRYVALWDRVGMINEDAASTMAEGATRLLADIDALERLAGDAIPARLAKDIEIAKADLEALAGSAPTRVAVNWSGVKLPESMHVPEAARRLVDMMANAVDNQKLYGIEIDAETAQMLAGEWATLRGRFGFNAKAYGTPAQARVGAERLLQALDGQMHSVRNFAKHKQLKGVSAEAEAALLDIATEVGVALAKEKLFNQLDLSKYPNLIRDSRQFRATVEALAKGKKPPKAAPAAVEAAPKAPEPVAEKPVPKRTRKPKAEAQPAEEAPAAPEEAPVVPDAQAPAQKPAWYTSRVLRDTGGLPKWREEFLAATMEATRTKKGGSFVKMLAEHQQIRSIVQTYGWTQAIPHIKAELAKVWDSFEAGMVHKGVADIDDVATAVAMRAGNDILLQLKKPPLYKEVPEIDLYGDTPDEQYFARGGQREQWPPRLTSELWQREPKMPQIIDSAWVYNRTQMLGQMLSDIAPHLPVRVTRAIANKIARFQELYIGSTKQRAYAEAEAIRKQIERMYKVARLENKGKGTRYTDPELKPPSRRLMEASDALRRYTESIEEENIRKNWPKYKKALRKVFGGTRGLVGEIMGSGDLSFGGTQAAGFIIDKLSRGDLGAIGKLFYTMVKAAFSESFYDKHVTDIMSRTASIGSIELQLYDWAYAGGMRLSEPHKMRGVASEEMFSSNIPKDTLPGFIAHLPGVKQWRESAARAFAAGGNEARFNQGLYKMLENGEISINDLSVVREFSKNLYKNTGKSPVHMSPEMLSVANMIIWALRLQMSKYAHVLGTGVWMDLLQNNAKGVEIQKARGPLLARTEGGKIIPWKLANTPRAQAFRVTAGFWLTFLGGALMLKKLGADVELDPDENTFGTVALPGTKRRLELAPGASGYVFRQLFFLGKHGGERVVGLAGGKKRRFNADSYDLGKMLGSGILGRLAPITGGLVGFATAKMDRRNSPLDEFASMTYPLSIGTFLETAKGMGAIDSPQKAAWLAGIMAMETVGVRTRQQPKRKGGMLRPSRDPFAPKLPRGVK